MNANKRRIDKIQTKILIRMFVHDGTCIKHDQKIKMRLIIIPPRELNIKWGGRRNKTKLLHFTFYIFSSGDADNWKYFFQFVLYSIYSTFPRGSVVRRAGLSVILITQNLWISLFPKFLKWFASSLSQPVLSCFLSPPLLTVSNPARLIDFDTVLKFDSVCLPL